MSSMNKDVKPRRVRAVITRIVTEVAVVTLDRQGNVGEIEEIYEERDYEVTSLDETLAVLTVHS